MCAVLLDLGFIPKVQKLISQTEETSSKEESIIDDRMDSIPSSIGQKGNNTVYNIL